MNRVFVCFLSEWPITNTPRYRDFRYIHKLRTRGWHGSGFSNLSHPTPTKKILSRPIPTKKHPIP